MEEELIIILMEVNIKDNGLIISSMVLGKFNFLMEDIILVNINKGKNVVEENFDGPKEHLILATLKMIILMEMEFTHLRMGKNILVNLKIIKEKEKEN